MSAPAGWYPDPADAATVRWWDGAQWTGYQQRALAPAYAAAPRLDALPRVDVNTNTVWIWLAIVVSFLPTLSLFVFTPGAYLNEIMGPDVTAEFLRIQAVSLGLSVLGWLVMAAYIVFSWLDHRELRQRGVFEPFHWAWAFLGLIVYVIGRAVVLRRRTESGGWAPLWVFSLLTILSLVAIGAWLWMEFATTFGFINDFAA